MSILQAILLGLPQGALYGLMGLGLSLIFGTTGVMNFAQGNSGMLGVFFAWSVLAWTKSLPLAIVAGIAAGALLGVGTDRILMKKVKGLTHGGMLIVTLGLLMAYEGLALIVWGTEPLLFPDLVTLPPLIWTLPPQVNPDGIPLIVAGSDLFVLALALVISLLFACFFKFTKIGLALKARSQDETGARVVGISVGAVDSLAWGAGVAICVVLGTLVAPKTMVTPGMLTTLQLYGFTAAVFGGFSSLFGAVVGGVILGVLEKLASLGLDALFTATNATNVNSADFQLSVILIVIIATLAIRPTGIFASRFKGKV